MPSAEPKPRAPEASMSPCGQMYATWDEELTRRLRGTFPGEPAFDEVQLDWLGRAFLEALPRTAYNSPDSAYLGARAEADCSPQGARATTAGKTDRRPGPAGIGAKRHAPRATPRTPFGASVLE